MSNAIDQLDPEPIREKHSAAALRRKFTEMLAEDNEFVDSRQFTREGIEMELFGNNSRPVLPDANCDLLAFLGLRGERVPSPRSVPPEEESVMFLRFNYSKRRLREIRHTAARDGYSRELAEEALLRRDRRDFYRDYLVRTNLRLVMAMARRTRLVQFDSAEALSIGNMALLRAVDKFGVDRGFRFSTYACRAIQWALMRSQMRDTRDRAGVATQSAERVEQCNWPRYRQELRSLENIDELKSIVDGNLAGLSKMEQLVIRQRFNWHDCQTDSLTLEAIGRMIGVTKERVRQIQLQAVEKIRRLMEDGGRRRAAYTPPPAWPPELMDGNMHAGKNRWSQEVYIRMIGTTDERVFASRSFSPPKLPLWGFSRQPWLLRRTPPGVAAV